mmetsp:Transcript_24025/g.95357  ORF Transcript_24025/g.95357 Transcript_24025/m.95357 type:complete len:317 (+) Transcript_24025:427-1377(+)
MCPLGSSRADDGDDDEDAMMSFITRLSDAITVGIWQFAYVRPVAAMACGVAVYADPRAPTSAILAVSNVASIASALGVVASLVSFIAVVGDGPDGAGLHWKFVVVKLAVGVVLLENVLREFFYEDGVARGEARTVVSNRLHAEPKTWTADYLILYARLALVELALVALTFPWVFKRTHVRVVSNLPPAATAAATSAASSLSSSSSSSSKRRRSLPAAQPDFALFSLDDDACEVTAADASGRTAEDAVASTFGAFFFDLVVRGVVPCVPARRLPGDVDLLGLLSSFSSPPEATALAHGGGGAYGSFGPKAAAHGDDR